MGIPAYFSHIIKNHTDVLQKQETHRPTEPETNLYLDCNSIIYDAIHELGDAPVSYLEIYTLVCKKIEEYIMLVRPTQNVLIALDGVAPVAKMQQQKTRRHKTFISKESTFNTCVITPNTDFMNGLNASITGYFSNPRRYQIQNIVLTLSNVAGEGEHKIFQFIRKYPDFHANTTTYVYGLDADLIMLGLSHLYITPHLFLVRESPTFAKSLNTQMENDVLYILNLDKLACYLLTEMKLSHVYDLRQTDPTMYKNRIHDYLLICFMLGNDFLPHFPSLNIRTNGIYCLLDAYVSTMGAKPICHDGGIRWGELLKLLTALAKWEAERFVEETKRMKGAKSIEIYVSAGETGWETRYYKSLFDIYCRETLDAKLKDVCINYLQGLEWVLKYYTQECYDWRWRYMYSYPPLFSNLIAFCFHYDHSFFKEKMNNKCSELVQQIYVLPSLDMIPSLPRDLRGELEKLELHRVDKTIDAYCKYDWETHYEFNDVSITEIEKLVMACPVIHLH